MIIRLGTKCLKIIQVYAPNSTNADEDVEAFCEESTTALDWKKIQLILTIGDFNAKLGHSLFIEIGSSWHHPIFQRHIGLGILFGFEISLMLVVIFRCEVSKEVTNYNANFGPTYYQNCIMFVHLIQFERNVWNILVIRENDCGILRELNS